VATACAGELVSTTFGDEVTETLSHDLRYDVIRAAWPSGERDAMGARTRTILDELHDVHHARDPLGRERLRSLPSGGRIHHEHDRMGRLSRRWATSSAAPQPDRVTIDRRHKYSAEGELPTRSIAAAGGAGGDAGKSVAWPEVQGHGVSIMTRCRALRLVEAVLPQPGTCPGPAAEPLPLLTLM
jgi:hypothetical protein